MVLVVLCYKSSCALPWCSEVILVHCDYRFHVIFKKWCNSKWWCWCCSLPGVARPPATCSVWCRVHSPLYTVHCNLSQYSTLMYCTAPVLVHCNRPVQCHWWVFVFPPNLEEMVQETRRDVRADGAGLVLLGQCHWLPALLCMVQCSVSGAVNIVHRPAVTLVQCVRSSV